MQKKQSNMNNQIDQRSYRLGGLSTFAEMVRVGVKTLALSAAVTPEEMDALAGRSTAYCIGGGCPALPRDRFNSH